MKKNDQNKSKSLSVVPKDVSPARGVDVGLDDLRVRLLRQPLDPAEIERCIEDVRKGRVHTLDDIAKMLRCSHELVRLNFRKEPGVVKFRQMYRVPETVLQRVLNRMMRGR